MSTLRTTNVIHGASAISNIVLDNQGRAIFGPDSPQGRAALYVNAQNNRVGVNTESPSVALDVDGAINATGNVAFGGTLSVTGNVTGDLNFNGNARIDSNGLFKAANGTAAAPSLTFLNDPDNGLFRETTNTLGFTTGGTHRASLSGGAGTIDLQFQETDTRISSNSDNNRIRIFGGGSFSVANGAALTLNGNTNSTDAGVADLASSGNGFIRFRNSTNELAYMTRADGTVNIGFGLGIVPSKGGSFGGNQNVIHIGGSSAPQLRIQSNSTDQCDLAIIGSNSGRAAEIQNVNGGYNIRASSGPGNPMELITSISSNRVAINTDDATLRVGIDAVRTTGAGQYARLYVTGKTSATDLENIIAKFGSANSNAGSRTYISISSGYAINANDTEGQVLIGAIRNGTGNTSNFSIKTYEATGGQNSRFWLSAAGNNNGQLGQASFERSGVSILVRESNSGVNFVRTCNLPVTFVASSTDGGSNTASVYWQQRFGSNQDIGCMGAVTATDTIVSPGSAVSGPITIFGFVGRF